MRIPRRRQRRGLRARVTLIFGLSGLLLSVTLAGVAYGLTRRDLLRQRESAALQQLYVNAIDVRRALRSPDPEIPAILGSRATANGAQAVLFFDGRWFAASLSLGRGALPDELESEVVRGRAARQRFHFDGEAFLAVGVPFFEELGAYFEIVPLGELDRTLRTLGTVLALAAAVTTGLSFGVGRWASGRALQPLAVAARAAGQIGEGRLDTRMAEQLDPELEVLAQAFNDMADALQRRIERDARFASDVSHELRSPLTTLANAVQLLQARRADLAPASRQAVDLLSDEVSRFEQMVDDLLEVSRSDDLHREPVRLAELVRHAVTLHSDEPVPLDVAPDAAELVVMADKRRLERVLANLVHNATTHGKGLTRVRVARSGSWGRIEVDDRGPGVSPDQRRRIFERFARGAAAGDRGRGGGVGLGLALVADGVAVHGGEVWVEDGPDGGSRFVVQLPLDGSA